MLKYKIQTDTQVIEFGTEASAIAYNQLNGNRFTIETFNDTAISASNQYLYDLNTYMTRAKVKDQIICEMAAENKGRVRAGIWTVGQLISLTQDQDLKHVLDDVMTLSFELAYAKIDLVANPLITPEIKQAWKAKLASHFYL